MAFIPVPLVAQVNVRQELDEQTVENTLYFWREAGWSSADLSLLGDTVRDWWEGRLAPHLSTGIRLVEVVASDLQTQDSEQVTTPAAAGSTGQIASGAMPNNTALCVSFRTDRRGRSSRGRNYVAGLAESDVTLSSVSATRGEAIRNAYEDLIVDAATAQCTWVVVSRYTNGQPRTAGSYLAVQAVTLVDLVVDSQRRRLPGRGR